jgi:hypothetical protein
MDVLEPERLLVKPGLAIRAEILPGGDIGKAVVVAPRFTILRLILFTKVAAARLLAKQGVAAHELTQLQEVRHASGLLERLVELRVAARNVHVAPELRPERRQPLERLGKARRIARHAAVVPT